MITKNYYPALAAIALSFLSVQRAYRGLFIRNYHNCRNISSGYTTQI